MRAGACACADVRSWVCSAYTLNGDARSLYWDVTDGVNIDLDASAIMLDAELKQVRWLGLM